MIFIIGSTVISNSDSSTGMQLIFIHSLSFLNLLNMYFFCTFHMVNTVVKPILGIVIKSLCMTFPIFVHLTIGKEIQIWKQIIMQSCKFSKRGLIKSVVRR